MNRTQLLAFAAVAETRSFTRGADRLMVSQPAVSLQVGELERTVGTRLFDRLPRGVRLTAAGELLLTYARRIDALEREAASALAELLGLRSGRLVIGASLTIGSYLLPELLGRFRRAHPEVELDLEIANSHTIERKLIDGLMDVAFTEGLTHEASLGTRTFAADRLVAVVPPGHELLSRRRVTAAMVCREPLLLREEGSGTREVVESALRSRGVVVRPAMSLGSAEALKRAVLAGLGVAFLSELAIADEVAAGRLRVLHVADLNIERPLVLLRPNGRSDSPAAAAFVEMVLRAPAVARRTADRARSAPSTRPARSTK